MSIPVVYTYCLVRNHTTKDHDRKRASCQSGIYLLHFRIRTHHFSLEINPFLGLELIISVWKSILFGIRTHHVSLEINPFRVRTHHVSLEFIPCSDQNSSCQSGIHTLFLVTTRHDNLEALPSLDSRMCLCIGDMNCTQQPTRCMLARAQTQGPTKTPNLHYEHGGPYSVMKFCFSFGVLANKRFQNLDPQNR